MPNHKTGVLLVNMGSPNSPSVADVRAFLREFLMDAHVIGVPYWRRFLLVNFIILPLHSFKSAQRYRELWMPEGFPLKVYGQELERLLQQALGGDFEVKLAMRYQSPSIKLVLSYFKDTGFKRLVVIPLYPQYALPSSGSAIDEVKDAVKQWPTAPEIKMISRFYDDPLYIKSMVQIGMKCMTQERFDHYLFSYHGLPECQNFKCSQNSISYSSQCFETTRLLVKELGIKNEDQTTCFQSRFGLEAWTKPYTDEVIKQLAGRGKKKVLVFSPSFVSDCLETIIEIGVEYNKLFLEHGGERLQLVESLNAHPAWVECLKQIILDSRQS